MNQSAINRLLVNAESSSEALRGLYDLFRQQDRKFSLSYFCRRADIPSTGYLADVFTGKRTLNRKYRSGICRAFDLTKDAGMCLKLLIEIDGERDHDRVDIAKRKLASRRKALRVTHRPISDDARSLFEALDVFCAFGLFENQPTERDLIDYFQDVEPARIRRSLELLKSMKLVVWDGNRHTLLDSHVLFGEGPDRLSHIDFLRMAITHAADSAEKWFPLKDEAYFTSTVASVKREDYVRTLQEIKERVVRVQSDLEAKDGDLLVRFNVQIYPMK